MDISSAENLIPEKNGEKEKTYIKHFSKLVYQILKDIEKGIISCGALGSSTINIFMFIMQNMFFKMKNTKSKPLDYLPENTMNDEDETFIRKMKTLEDFERYYRKDFLSVNHVGLAALILNFVKFEKVNINFEWLASQIERENRDEEEMNKLKKNVVKYEPKKKKLEKELVVEEIYNKIKSDKELKKRFDFLTKFKSLKEFGTDLAKYQRHEAVWINEICEKDIDILMKQLPENVWKLEEINFMNSMKLLLNARDIFKYNLDFYTSKIGRLEELIKGEIDTSKNLGIFDDHHIFGLAESDIILACSKLIQENFSRYRFFVDANNIKERKFIDAENITKDTLKLLEHLKFGKFKNLQRDHRITKKYVIHLNNLLATDKAQKELNIACRNIKIPTVHDSSSKSSVSSTTSFSSTQSTTRSSRANDQLTCGIENIKGKICYANSALQIMFNIPEMRTELEKLTNECENPILIYMRSIYKNYVNNALNNKGPVKPNKQKLKKMISSPKMNGFRDKEMEPTQGCISEFFDILIDSFSKCNDNSQVSSLFDIDNTAWRSFSTTLSVKEFKEVNLSETVRKKIRENGFTHNKILPKYFILSCARFKNNLAQKDETAITISQTINIDGQHYKLKSIAIHTNSTSTNSGHYIAFNRIENTDESNKFFEFDDSRVTKIDFKDKQKSIEKKFVLLVYQKTFFEFSAQQQNFNEVHQVAKRIKKEVFGKKINRNTNRKHQSLKLNRKKDIKQCSSQSSLESLWHEEDKRKNPDYYDSDKKKVKRKCAKNLLRADLVIDTREICQNLYKSHENQKGVEEGLKLINEITGRELSDYGSDILGKKLLNLKLEINRLKRNAKSRAGRKFSRVFPQLSNEYKSLELFEQYFVKEKSIELAINPTELPGEASSKKKKVGRPRKMHFFQMGRSSQYSYIKRNARKVKSIEVALRIAARIAKQEKQDRTNNLLKTLLERQSKEDLHQKADNNDKSSIKKVPSYRAYLLMLQCNLSVRSYKRFKKFLKEFGADILPSYDRLLTFKKSRIPLGLKTTDRSASVPIQELADNTAYGFSSLVKLAEVMKEKNISKGEKLKAKLTNIFGIDGTSQLSPYHMPDEKGKKLDDRSLLVASMSPMEFIVTREDGEELIKWSNPLPGSRHWNRLISIEYVRETEESVVNLYNNLKEQIENLQTRIFEEEGYSVEVSHDFIFSMIDGKIIKILTKTRSFMCCPCCDLGPKEFGNKDNLYNGKFKLKKKNIAHTVQPLHGIINITLALYKVSCRLDKRLKKWRILKTDLDAFLERKAIVKQRIFDAFGIHFDEVRQGGSGTSVTGSVCRKMLKDPKLLAKTLELDEELVCRLATILQVLNCSEYADPDKFEKYAYRTYEIFLEKYPFYYPPCTLHKILAHGGQIIRTAPLPLGKMSEESLEANNYAIKSFREFHARKTSRRANLEDIFVRIYMLSDPWVANESSKDSIKKKEKRKLSESARALLLNNEQDQNQEVQDENSGNEEKSEETLNLFDDLEEYNEPIENFRDEDEDDLEKLILIRESAYSDNETRVYIGNVKN